MDPGHVTAGWAVSNALAIMSVAEVQAMADAVAASGLFACAKTPQTAFALMMLCQAEGIHPMQAVRRYDIVNGKVALKADTMLAEFQNRGGKVTWVKVNSAACEAIFHAPGITDPVTVTWTIGDAERAGLAGKTGPWTQYPRAMLRARVISEGIRMTMPGVVVGLYTPEEVQDFAEVKPTAPPKAQPQPALSAEPSAPSAAAPTEPLSPGPGDDSGESEPVGEPPPIRDLVECFWWRKKKGDDPGGWETRGMFPKANNQQIAKIHILADEMRMDDAGRRAGMVKYFNKSTAADLSVEEASEMIDRMQKKMNRFNSDEATVEVPPSADDKG